MASTSSFGHTFQTGEKEEDGKRKEGWKWTAHSRIQCGCLSKRATNSIFCSGNDHGSEKNFLIKIKKKYFLFKRAYSQFEKRQLRHFFIYYQLSSQSFKDVNKIPLELPLMIAYKSDTGNVVHSQIKRFVSKENNNNDNKDNAELWCAIPYDSNGNPVAEPYHLG